MPRLEVKFVTIELTITINARPTKSETTKPFQ